MKVALIDHCGSDLTTANAARVSFNKHSEELSAGDVKLINYLAKHKHISPFGHCFASFRIKCSIATARQLVKHKFLRINEISRRYVTFDPEYHEVSCFRGRPEGSIKQGSSGPVEDQAACRKAFDDAIRVADHAYKELLKLNVAPEQARLVLPQAMFTEFYWSGSLDAFAAMCKLRCAEDTQVETRLVADGIREHLEDLYPVSFTALMEY